MGVRAVRKDSLTELITALCNDYIRRKEAIRQSRFSHRVTVEYKYINFKILDAAREIAGDAAEVYIREIGNNIGYANTAMEEISETAYKLKKQEIKMNIARKLHLTD